MHFGLQNSTYHFSYTTFDKEFSLRFDSKDFVTLSGFFLSYDKPRIYFKNVNVTYICIYEHMYILHIYIHLPTHRV